MQVIKLGIISLVVFFLLVTGISLFIPSHIRISKAIDIAANKDKALQQVGNAENWKNWFPGADTMQQLLVEGKVEGIITKGQHGIIIDYRSDSLITAINAGPVAREGGMGWNIIQNGNQPVVTVQWYMDFYFSWYPWEKFSSLLLEKRYGVLMDQGLEKLKNELEK